MEKLERLDDLVFDTINGRRPALEELTQLWPQMIAELPRELWAESREQYLRYAIVLWESSMTGGVRDPQWAVGRWTCWPCYSTRRPEMVAKRP